MPNPSHMFDLQHFNIGSLKDTPLGGLFLPVIEGGQRFVAGRLNHFPVLVVLDGGAGNAFRVADPEQWSRRSGLHVQGGRFQVDPGASIPVRDPEDAPPGSFVLSKQGPMIIAYDHNGSKAVLLAGGEGSTDISEMAVAFTAWQYVVGGPSDTHPVFSFRATV